MEKKVATDLTNVSDLLFMLERLVDGLSYSRSANVEIPWEGIRFTLQQSRETIENVNTELAREAYAEDLPSGVELPVSGNGAARKGSEKSVSIAERIKRVPSENGVKELHLGSKDSKTDEG